MAMPPSSGMSGDFSTDLYYGCSKVWQCNALYFHADGDQRAKTCLDTNSPASVCKIGMVRHLLETYLKTKNRPSSISYIELCYFLSDVAVCVAHSTAKTSLPPILFAGGAWLQVTWSASPAAPPAGGSGCFFQLGACADKGEGEWI
jgi:hypothetical protein